MALSGKLILAWMEEDNEQRALFRVRPLMTSEGAITGQEIDQLPDEGYLRVVPDRKEQATFKDRMRALGQLCVIDLCGSIEKTRANKNYSPAKGEVNRTVVYSDVVVDVPEALVYEVVPDLKGALPMTPRFCLRNGGRIQGPLNAATREPEGAQIAVAPDSSRLFAVQLPDGREKLFFWPDIPAGEQPPQVQPVQEAAEASPEAPPDEADEPLIKETPQPEQNEAPHLAPSPRVHIPIHEVVERKRGARDAQLASGPEPAEAFRQSLDVLWREEDTRIEAMRILADMPDADVVMGRAFKLQMKTPAAAVLRRELEDMEAERLRLLMETDHARSNRDALFSQALDAARERAERTLAALKAEEQAASMRVDQIQTQEKSLLVQREQLLSDLESAGATVLKRPAGEACSFADAARRMAEALNQAGIAASETWARCLLLLLLTCPQVQLEAENAADSVTAARAVARALGANAALFPKDEHGVLLPAGGDGTRLMITASGSTAPDGYTRLIAGQNGGPKDTSLMYEREPWPCLPVSVRPGFFAAREQTYPAVSWASLQAQLPTEPAHLPEPAAELLAAVEQAFLKADAPLPLAIRQAVARFVPAAQVLAGSVLTALDTALTAFVLPYARCHEVDMSGLVPLLAGFSQSEARLS